jgi:hypothetical protein
MNDALEEEPVFAGADRIAVEIILDDLRRRDLRWRHAARHPVAILVAPIASTDVAVGVEHALVGQDPVGRDQIFEQFGIAHGRGRNCSV